METRGSRKRKVLQTIATTNSSSGGESNRRHPSERKAKYSRAAAHSEAAMADAKAKEDTTPKRASSQSGPFPGPLSPISAVSSPSSTVRSSNCSKTSSRQEAQAGGGGGKTRMFIAVRIRPLSAKEQAAGIRPCCDTEAGSNGINDNADSESIIEGGGGVVTINRGASGGGYLKSQQGTSNDYCFDRAFGMKSTQAEVYEGTTKPFIKDVLDGINVTVFAYGATGAGKTHTMMGSERVVGVTEEAGGRGGRGGRGGSGAEAPAAEVSGIVPQSLVDVFKGLKKRQQAAPDETWTVEVSYLEVYNEQLLDLLEPSSKALKLLEDKEKGQMRVLGLAKRPVGSSEEVLQLLREGNSHRKTESTGANSVSSRSHAVLRLMVTRAPSSGGRGRGPLSKGRDSSRQQPQLFRGVESTLSLIDLAGSERASATKNKGEQLRQGANINKSLLSLANCINALAANAGKKGKSRPTNVKYRDSKLTHLLKTSLEGQCSVVMITNVNPSHLTFEDTHNSLKYADRAKQIKLDPAIKEQRRLAAAASSSSSSSSSLAAAGEREALLQMEVKELREANATLQETVQELSKRRASESRREGGGSGEGGGGGCDEMSRTPEEESTNSTNSTTNTTSSSSSLLGNDEEEDSKGKDKDIDEGHQTAELEEAEQAVKEGQERLRSMQGTIDALQAQVKTVEEASLANVFFQKLEGRVEQMTSPHAQAEVMSLLHDVSTAWVQEKAAEAAHLLQQQKGSTGNKGGRERDVEGEDSASASSSSAGAGAGAVAATVGEEVTPSCLSSSTLEKHQEEEMKRSQRQRQEEKEKEEEEEEEEEEEDGKKKWQRDDEKEDEEEGEDGVGGDHLHLRSIFSSEYGRQLARGKSSDEAAAAAARAMATATAVLSKGAKEGGGEGDGEGDRSGNHHGHRGMLNVSLDSLDFLDSESEDGDHGGGGGREKECYEHLPPLHPQTQQTQTQTQQQQQQQTESAARKGCMAGWMAATETCRKEAEQQQLVIQRQHTKQPRTMLQEGDTVVEQPLAKRRRRVEEGVRDGTGDNATANANVAAMEVEMDDLPRRRRFGTTLKGTSDSCLNIQRNTPTTAGATASAAAAGDKSSSRNRKEVTTPRDRKGLSDDGGPGTIPPLSPSSATKSGAAKSSACASKGSGKGHVKYPASGIASSKKVLSARVAAAHLAMSPERHHRRPSVPAVASPSAVGGTVVAAAVEDTTANTGSSSSGNAATPAPVRQRGGLVASAVRLMIEKAMIGGGGGGEGEEEVVEEKEGEEEEEEVKPLLVVVRLSPIESRVLHGEWGGRLCEAFG